MWRGGVGKACLLPTLSFVGAQVALPCSVSTSRSSNRTGGSPASGSRMRHHAVAHGRLRVKLGNRTSPNRWVMYSAENRAPPLLRILCLLHNHRCSRLMVYVSTATYALLTGPKQK
jgi:hypothetical protein